VSFSVHCEEFFKAWVAKSQKPERQPLPWVLWHPFLIIAHKIIAANAIGIRVTGQKG
jgi:hypothetical protein